MAEKELSFGQRALHRGFNLTRLIFDPFQYAKDEEMRAKNEIDARLKFYLLNDINKTIAGIDSEETNNLTDAERVKYFGKTQLATEDITWEALERVLRPQATKGAVFRVNDSLQGSHVNERFSKISIEGGEDRASISHPEYVPRTVTLYDSEEHAKVAAKLLRMLTKSSHAVIIAEPIERGLGSPQWVVSDSMNLETHNALRLIFTHLYAKLPPEKREQLKVSTQKEVDSRLPRGETWEALEGVGTFLTLAGRPGVKMYKRLPNGQDCPKDKEHVDKIPKQHLPVHVRGVPHRTVIAPDGRRYTATGNPQAIIGHLLLGPEGYAFVKGDRKAIGHVLHNEVDEDFEGVVKNPSAFGKGKAVADVFSLVTSPIDKVVEIGSGCLSVMLTGGAMLLCTGSYQTCKALSKKLSKGKWEFDPIEHTFLPYVIKKAGDPREPRLTKEWTPRLTDEPLKIHADELSILVVPNQEQSLQSPLGDVVHKPLEDTTKLKWVNNLPAEFSRYMTVNRLWPTHEDFTDHGRWKLPATGSHFTDEYVAIRDRLANAYVHWVEEARLQSERMNPKHSPVSGITPTAQDAMQSASDTLANELNALVATIQGQHALPGHIANRIILTTREALRKGMEGFLVERQLMVNSL